MSNESRIIAFLMFLLIAFGIVMIYSASAMFADEMFGSATYFLSRQLFYLILGSLLFALSLNVNLEFLRIRSKLFMLVALSLLVLVFIPAFGHTAGGARRWLGFGVFTFQPVEYAKLAVCLYFSDYLTRKMRGLTEGVQSVLIPPLAVLFVLIGLLILQPDLGSSIFILLITGILFLLAGIPISYVFLALIPTVMAVAVLIVQAPYRLNRVVAFLNPWKDPKGGGFQIIQSFISFALGGIKGVGLGQSTQKLFYLPQSHTDFIFSIVGEELGLIGTTSLLSLYVVFFLVGIRISNKTQYPFYRLFAYSLSLMITLQALIHMMVTTGLIPTKGLPLPFVSYGGTSLIFNMLAVGILLAIDRHITYRSFRRA